MNNKVTSLFSESEISKTLKNSARTAILHEKGEIIYVGVSVLEARGIDNSFIGEVVCVGDTSRAYVFGFREETVQLIFLEGKEQIRVGDPVFRTGQALKVPVGRSLLGRIVNPMGLPIDGKGTLISSQYRHVENPAPSVIQRKPVTTPMHTGIKTIDSMIPIGKGQRELVVGDRQTGKSSILIDTIINQVKSDVICVYVAISQRSSSIASIIELLQLHGAFEHTILVVSLAEDPTSLRYLAPFSGVAIAEHFAEQGKDVLIVYDDLSKHADSYRELSLLLQRPPAREAYPSDVFYLHSRLLERAGNFTEALGGGSITALPVIETQGGDISQYIPTNIISITDGQIYLEKELFNSGVRPAINVGLSVSRIGGSAQTRWTRKVSGSLRLELSQYNDLKSFTEFGGDLDKETLFRLKRGELLVELMKQKNNSPLSIESQVMMLFAYSKHLLDDIPLDRIHEFELGFLRYVEKNVPQLYTLISLDKPEDKVTAQKLEQSLLEFKQMFLDKDKIE